MVRSMDAVIISFIKYPIVNPNLNYRLTSSISTQRTFSIIIERLPTVFRVIFITIVYHSTGSTLMMAKQGISDNILSCFDVLRRRRDRSQLSLLLNLVSFQSIVEIIKINIILNQLIGITKQIPYCLNFQARNVSQIYEYYGIDAGEKA